MWRGSGEEWVGWMLRLGPLCLCGCFGGCGLERRTAVVKTMMIDWENECGTRIDRVRCVLQSTDKYPTKVDRRTEALIRKQRHYKENARDIYTYPRLRSSVIRSILHHSIADRRAMMRRQASCCDIRAEWRARDPATAALSNPALELSSAAT